MDSISRVPVPDITPDDIARITGTITTTEGRSIPFTIHGDGTLAARRSAWPIVSAMAAGLHLPTGDEPTES